MSALVQSFRSVWVRFRFSTESRLAKPKHPIKPRTLRTKEAAEYLGISEWKLRELVQEGRIPYLPGRGSTSPWLFDKADLDEYIESEKVRFHRIRR